MKSGRIVLTTFGSLGDLHPFIALALGLKARGHEVVIAATGYYRDKIEAEGIGFASMRPDFLDHAQVKQIVRDVMDMRKGPEVVIRKVVLPHLRESYEDLMAATDGADLLINSTLTYAGPLVAEKRGLPWVSTALQPTSLFSCYDDMILAPAPWLAQVHKTFPLLYRALLRLADASTRPWAQPIETLRRAEGLAPSPSNPILRGGHSPYLLLALFSSLLCGPMPDWPPHTCLTGFAFHDRNRGQGLEPDLEAFLAAGPPPIVFTLGSAAVMDAGRFYEDSVCAARQIGARALLLIGDEPENRPIEAESEQIGVFSYAPYSEVFPRCAAIVHQGGVGTTGQAMRAGRPMLVMPYGQDQPDNAARVVRLGIARTIDRKRYGVETAARELKALQAAEYAQQAQEVGTTIRSENGTVNACDAIEELLSGTRDTGATARL